MCVSQAKPIKPIYSHSVCDHGDPVRGSSASFQDVALVTAGTRKALSQTTQRKQARPAANPRSAPKQTTTSTRSSDTLLNELKQMASEVINKDVSADAPLMDAGLDSISATELSNKISAHLDTELSPTLLFDHPTLRSIADSLPPNYSAVVPLLEPQPNVAYKQLPQTPKSRDALLKELINIASEVIGTTVSADAPLMEAGLDSISATEL